MSSFLESPFSLPPNLFFPLQGNYKRIGDKIFAITVSLAFASHELHDHNVPCSCYTSEEVR